MSGCGVAAPDFVPARVVDGTPVPPPAAGPPAMGGGPNRPPALDPRRSLAVTDEPILRRFSFQRVLEQLVTQGGVPNLTAGELFQRWWDTQQSAPGKFADNGWRCGGETDGYGPTMNGFPYDCRESPSEGRLADADPFTAPETNPDAFIPIGLFNRFDLAPANGAHCGEHRIVYAKRSGLADRNDRLLIIFEPILPNPRPEQGLKGCQRIVRFWADLTDEPDLEKRAAALETLYFRGLGGMPPVIHADHFGANALGAGQVRTNQFMQPVAPRIWTLREFKLDRTCDGAACTRLAFRAVTNKGNPHGGLFDPLSTHPQAAAFRAHLVASAPALAAATSVLSLDLPVPDQFNSGQSHANNSDDTRYAYHLGGGPTPFRAELEAAVAASGISVDDLVARAQALSCAGCHDISKGASLGAGLTFPPSLRFVHVSEIDPEVADGVVRYRISPALTDLFLPHRRTVLLDFLADKPMNARRPEDPIGGFRTH